MYSGVGWVGNWEHYTLKSFSENLFFFFFKHLTISLKRVRLMTTEPDILIHNRDQLLLSDPKQKLLIHI